MTEETTAGSERLGSWPAIALYWIGNLAAIAFMIGAVAILLHIHNLYVSGDQLMVHTSRGAVLGRLYEAMLFALGFGVGSVGAITAVAFSSAWRKMTGTGMVLVGSGFIWLGFLLASELDRDYWFSRFPSAMLIGPLLLFGYGIWLMLRSIRLLSAEESANEEQQSPQSPP